MLAFCQEKLLRAAKARLDRMCAPKSRRKDLEVPDWVRAEWNKSENKTKMATLLQEENFSKERPIKTILCRRQACSLEAEVKRLMRIYGSRLSSGYRIS